MKILKKNICITISLIFLIISNVQFLKSQTKSLFQGQGQILNADLEKRAKKLENEIMAPCCFGGTLITHAESSLTTEMKKNLRFLLKKGLSAEKVIKNMVEHYGKKMKLPANEWQRIRATPEKAGFNLLVWLLPVFGSIAGVILVGWIIYIFVNRGTALKKKKIVPQPETVNPEMKKRIDEELEKIESL